MHVNLLKSVLYFILASFTFNLKKPEAGIIIRLPKPTHT